MFKNFLESFDAAYNEFAEYQCSYSCLCFQATWNAKDLRKFVYPLATTDVKKEKKYKEDKKLCFDDFSLEFCLLNIPVSSSSWSCWWCGMQNADSGACVPYSHSAPYCLFADMSLPALLPSQSSQCYSTPLSQCDKKCWSDIKYKNSQHSKSVLSH